ncbi:MAG: hypothetical protein LBP69_09530 [Treponema sp.]|nr:hypothetical protein [Treponema sp.]
MLEYKKGDTVRIRSKEWMDAQKKDNDGDITRGDSVFFHPMFQYAGKLAVITQADTDSSYKLDIDVGHWWWCGWMFDPDFQDGEPLSAEDAIRAMLDGETLYDTEGHAYWYVEDRSGFWTNHGCCVDKFDGLCRRPAKRKRPMTRFEVLNWANSEASRGWVVRHSDTGFWWTPQYPSYIESDFENYQRARLLPDLSGVDEDTIQGFEVEK